MNKTKILQDILTLLKAAKSHPEQFASLLKDDMPHPANSPEDKAHDVKEEDEGLKQALQLLDTPEKKAKMLEHLRSLQDEADLRSPENQEVGQESMEKSYEKGVHQSVKAKGLKGGMSRAGLQTRISKEPSVKGHPAAQESATEAKEMHQTKLKELKQMPKPNLPKSEKDTDKGDKDMSKSEKSALDLAKELLKAAKENPAQFEELSKALAPAMAPMPKPSMPKPKMSAPKPPKMQAPGMMKEEKEESKEDRDERHDEKHDDKNMEKADKKMEKCGPMKMSKEEIKDDLKKEWKPKFKKEKC